MKANLKLITSKPLQRARGTSIQYVSSDYAPKHEHLVFARQQSNTMRDMDWESSIRPRLSYCQIGIRAIGVMVALGLIAWWLV